VEGGIGAWKLRRLKSERKTQAENSEHVCACSRIFVTPGVRGQSAPLRASVHRHPTQACEMSDSSLQLPAGWVSKWSSTRKRAYYFHSATNQKSWTLPTAGDEASAEDQDTKGQRAKKQKKDVDKDLPDGWIVKWSEKKQKEYYFNPVTKESHWDKDKVILKNMESEGKHKAKGKITFPSTHNASAQMQGSTSGALAAMSPPLHPVPTGALAAMPPPPYPAPPGPSAAMPPPPLHSAVVPAMQPLLVSPTSVFGGDGGIGGQAGGIAGIPRSDRDRFRERAWDRTPESLQRDRDRRYRERESDRDRDRDREGGREGGRERESERNRDRDRDREGGREGERERESERNRDRDKDPRDRGKESEEQRANADWGGQQDWGLHHLNKTLENTDFWGFVQTFLQEVRRLNHVGVSVAARRWFFFPEGQRRRARECNLVQDVSLFPEPPKPEIPKVESST
jgi:hypothetical protein